MRASGEVEVFSPNHLELVSLFEESTRAREEQTFDRGVIEIYARKFLNASSRTTDERMRAIVVRAGEHGCLILPRDAESRWLPPFYDSTSSKIVDPTGAGNAFLGAFTVALQKKEDLVEAAVWGSVAASLALEQIGLPSLGLRQGERLQTWNEEAFEQRLHE